jgi:hypothetical protein
MQTIMKPLLSLLSIGIFILFALSSDFLDESTNHFITLDDCEGKPPFTGTLTIAIQYLTANSLPVVGAECRINIVHQITDIITCESSVVGEATIERVLDNQGRCSFETASFTHENSIDLFRVDVSVIPKEEDLHTSPTFRDVHYALYNTTTLTFFKQAAKPL